MESHLAQCLQCRQKLENYSLLSRCDRDSVVYTTAEAAVQDRVWKKLGEKTGMDRLTGASEETAGPYMYQFKRDYHPNFWNRKISISLPAAAAALLFIIAAAALWTYQSKGRQAPPNMMTVASEEFSLWPSAKDTGFDSPGMVPVTDLNGVLQYLGAKDSGDIVILRLPETRSFSSAGEPAIVRAADYSRRKP